MTALYPLRFEPLFREYLWGGRRLGTVLNKPIGDGPTFAESWEIVDHGQDQSVVAAGSLAGTTLRQLIEQRASDLLGAAAAADDADAGAYPQLPLLLKFLDAQKNLSVQVHPNDQQAQQLDPPDLGKTEAWIVLDADDEAQIYAGLRSDVDAETFRQHIEQGTTDQCLHAIRPQAGDCIFVPAGTVHAIGAGVMVAELQQSSDTTYRIFDWNRVDKDGQPRQLHIEQAMQVIDFDRGPIEPVADDPQQSVQTLIRCEKFVIHRHRWQPDTAYQVGETGRMTLLAVLAGSLQVEGDPSPQPLEKGCSMLVPAAVGAVNVQTTTDCCVLEMHLP